MTDRYRPPNNSGYHNGRSSGRGSGPGWHRRHGGSQSQVPTHSRSNHHNLGSHDHQASYYNSNRGGAHRDQRVESGNRIFSQVDTFHDQFTFRSDHPAPAFGDNPRRKKIDVQRRRPNQGAYIRNPVSSERGRQSDNARYRPHAHEPLYNRPLLQKQRSESPDHVIGVAPGSKRFRNVDLPKTDSSDNGPLNSASTETEEPVSKRVHIEESALALASESDVAAQSTFAPIEHPKSQQKEGSANIEIAASDVVVGETPMPDPKKLDLPNIVGDLLVPVQGEGRNGASVDEPEAKKVRVEGAYGDGGAVPKWSDCSSGVALPPPPPHKRVDVIKLIRDARIAQGPDPNAARNSITANDDYVPLVDESADNINDNAQEMMASTAVSVLPLAPSRKRSHDQVDTDSDTGSKMVDAWKPTASTHNIAPWFRRYSKLTDPLQAFHNEILDFYDFVKPVPHENDIRQEICDRVEHALCEEFGQNFHIGAFGSFAAGLYLPTADMDLVFLSNGPQPKLSMDSFKQVKHVLDRAAKALRKRGLAGHSCLKVWRAKVPIVKFVDVKTRLSVDISFENKSGLTAQETLRQWASEYEEMPPLVALVKQFLLMRNLNEVRTGGLGGFSIVCLVISFLHHFQKSKDVRQANYAELFLEFLDFYGNRFDLDRQMISLNPPGYVPKSVGAPGIDGRRIQPGKLSIQDPNNSYNDVAGGSFDVPKVMQCFQNAHNQLQQHLAALGNTKPLGQSILALIIGGNYQSFFDQRAHLEHLY